MIISQQSSFLRTTSILKGAKHMELKYLVVKEEVHKCRASIEHISTNLMIVDHLTKGLLPKLYVGHIKKMSIKSSSEC